MEVEDIASHIGAKGPIRPGDGESKIIQLIIEKVGDRMPAKGPPLSEEEIAIITEWVKEGAGLGKGVPFAVKNQKAIAVGEWTNTEGVKIAAELEMKEKRDAELCIQRWMKQESVLILRWQDMLVELHATKVPDFAMFAVANRELLDLAQSSLH